MRRKIEPALLTHRWRPDRLTDYVWMIDWPKYGLPFSTVYVIAPESKWPIKIGVSNSPRKRLADLQTSHWKVLHVMKGFWCASAKDALKVEREAHRMLREDNRCLLGEWFDRTAEQAEEVIRFAAARHDVALGDEVPTEEIEDALYAELRKLEVMSNAARFDKRNDWLDAEP